MHIIFLLFNQALRSTDKSSDPLIVSIGNKICLDSALKIVSKCCKYRVPEPVLIIINAD